MDSEITFIKTCISKAPTDRQQEVRGHLDRTEDGEEKGTRTETRTGKREEETRKDTAEPAKGNTGRH